MRHWLDRLMRGEHWMVDAVRQGLDAYVQESEGRARRRSERREQPPELPREASTEACPSIP